MTGGGRVGHCPVVGRRIHIVEVYDQPFQIGVIVEDFLNHKPLLAANDDVHPAVVVALGHRNDPGSAPGLSNGVSVIHNDTKRPVPRQAIGDHLFVSLLEYVKRHGHAWKKDQSQWKKGYPSGRWDWLFSWVRHRVESLRCGEQKSGKPSKSKKRYRIMHKSRNDKGHPRKRRRRKIARTSPGRKDWSQRIRG